MAVGGRAAGAGRRAPAVYRHHRRRAPSYLRPWRAGVVLGKTWGCCPVDVDPSWRMRGRLLAGEVLDVRAFRPVAVLVPFQARGRDISQLILVPVDENPDVVVPTVGDLH